MSTSQQPPLGRLHQVDGRRLFLHRSGAGGPAVVFLPGASAFGLDYLNVHERVSAFTTSVLHDRAGTGWSDPAELPRTAAEVATELRDLLRAADVPGPYVLVAHSLGGAYARRFLQLFPDEVAGVVYLDAFNEDWDVHMADERLRLKPQPVPGDVMLRLVTLLAGGQYRKMLATWPREVRDALLARHLTVASQRAGAQERGDMPGLAAEIRAAGPVPGRPLLAFTALGVDPAMKLMMPKKTLTAMSDGKIRLGEALAAAAPGGEHRVLENARHSTICTDEPDAVSQGVRDLWQRVC
ncbi:alpha/beta hydrolase [Nonomuraea sp. SMC257]|uniref:Alpha/beta hydrolase n=1 Tax=Nonomuraea montanisoli TaxID=2741721 RepID=A0A7Y6IDW3_9ACTN|nr:alpha/beta hydrolase [Nonomuraea montanisoli]NUW36356.1 alpha/beta hydrolase [Nonomuraea montanisoli]